MLKVDGDMIVFPAAIISQEENPFDPEAPLILDFEKAKSKAIALIKDKQKILDDDEIILTFSCSREDNWRRKYLPSYKADREPSPLLIPQLKEFLSEEYHVITNSCLEADDLLAMMQDPEDVNSIVCSGEKDMFTIPGRTYLWNRKIDKTQTLREANEFHFEQVLQGDRTDGYFGCPGIGPAKAKKILAEFKEINCEIEYQQAVWEKLIETFAKKDLTEEDLKIQYYVSRLLRKGEFDFKKKEVKLLDFLK